MSILERKTEVRLERQLLAVLVTECPTGPMQERSGQLYNDLLRHAEADHKTIMRSLAGALYDGLAYGNWP